ncbi:hypothetical protein ACIPW6_35685, partial [Streptomyces rubrogriseus]
IDVLHRPSPPLVASYWPMNRRTDPPNEMTSKQFVDGFVVEWGRRIPLPALAMDGIEPLNDDGPGEIDIPVDFR